MNTCSKNCHSCSIREDCLFCVLNTKDKEIFNNQKKFTNFQKGSNVFKENAKADDLFIVNKGMIKLVNYGGKKNNEYTISVFQAGDVIGMEALLKDNKFKTMAFAICDVSVCRINRTIIRHFTQKNADVLEYLFEKVLKTQCDLICRMETMSKDNAEIRLLKVVGLLAKSGNCPDKRKVIIKQSELAGLSNISRETVSRILNKYKKTKLLQVREGEIMILDQQKLNTILKSASC